MTNIKDDFYNEDTNKPKRRLTGLERICALTSDTYGERWNFVCGGVQTVKVEGL